MKFFDKSSILIVNDIDIALEELLPFYPSHFTRIIKNEEKSEFQIPQAQIAIKEAYVSTNEIKYLFLCAESFRIEAQNALLKILEEPPVNIVFILITTSKNSLLPTIYSRLSYQYLKKPLNQEIEIDLNLKYLDLKQVYNFIKANQKINKKDAILTVETILKKINQDKVNLKEKELNIFSKSIRLLELNSRPINVLSYLLLSILEKE